MLCDWDCAGDSASGYTAEVLAFILLHSKLETLTEYGKSADFHQHKPLQAFDAHTEHLNQHWLSFI
jgi:hypothetical protein